LGGFAATDAAASTVTSTNTTEPTAIGWTAAAHVLRFSETDIDFPRSLWQ
jgi:hypothetical protein